MYSSTGVELVPWQNFHVSGVTPDTYAAVPALSSFYRVISTNVDANGKVRVGRDGG